MKEVNRRPVEWFCHDCDSWGSSEKFALDVAQQYCMYTNGMCVKPRKSTPNVKVGICTVGSTVAKGGTVRPVIICPQRFKEDAMFDTVRMKYLSNWSNVKWVPEVSIGSGGNVDYVAVETDDGGNVSDFLCVEIQAAGTTSTPYPYVQDLKKNGHFEKDYTYGINWANEFSKTMMQQAYKKGRIIEHWGRKIVFVVQDVAIEYLRSASDCSRLVDRDDKLPIDFCQFAMTWKDNRWMLSFSSIVSTDLQGIDAMLGGAPKEDWLTEDDFKANILKKGIAEGILEKVENK